MLRTGTMCRMWKLKGAVAVLMIPVWLVVWLWGKVGGKVRGAEVSRCQGWRSLRRPLVHEDSRHIPPGA